MKPTAAELARRIEETKQALLQGLPRYVIVQNFSQRYSVTDRTIDNYISKARAGLQNDLDGQRPYMLAEHIAHRRDLRRRFRQANDLHGELKAAQDEAKLLTLYEFRFRDWHDEIIDALRKGEIDPADVREAFPDLAADFFIKAGVKVDD